MKKNKKPPRKPLTEARVRELIAEELAKRAACPCPLAPVQIVPADPPAAPPYLPYAYAAPQPFPIVTVYACQTFDPHWKEPMFTVTYTGAGTLNPPTTTKVGK